MMKLKKWSKKAALLAASLGVIWGTSLTAFAFVPDDVNAEVQTESVQEETAPTKAHRKLHRQKHRRQHRKETDRL